MSLSSLPRCRWRFVVEGVRHEAIQVERHAWKMSHVNTSPILETSNCYVIPVLNANINVQLVILMSCKAIAIHVSAICITCAHHTTAVVSFAVAGRRWQQEPIRRRHHSTSRVRSKEDCCCEALLTLLKVCFISLLLRFCSKKIVTLTVCISPRLDVISFQVCYEPRNEGVRNTISNNASHKNKRTENYLMKYFIAV